MRKDSGKRLFICANFGLNKDGWMDLKYSWGMEKGLGIKEELGLIKGVWIVKL